MKAIKWLIGSRGKKKNEFSGGRNYAEGHKICFSNFSTCFPATSPLTNDSNSIHVSLKVRNE